MVINILGRLSNEIAHRRIKYTDVPNSIPADYAKRLKKKQIIIEQAMEIVLLWRSQFEVQKLNKHQGSFVAQYKHISMAMTNTHPIILKSFGEFILFLHLTCTCKKLRVRLHETPYKLIELWLLRVPVRTRLDEVEPLEKLNIIRNRILRRPDLLG